MRRSELTLFVDRDRRENPSQDVVEIEVLSIVNPWRRILDDIGIAQGPFTKSWPHDVSVRRPGSPERTKNGLPSVSAAGFNNSADGSIPSQPG